MFSLRQIEIVILVVDLSGEVRIVLMSKEALTITLLPQNKHCIKVGLVINKILFLTAAYIWILFIFQ
jgi:hypothetical protein